MKSFFTFFVLPFCLLFSLSVTAQEDALFHILPTEYTSSPGNGGFLGPLYSGARTCQLLIHEDQLNAIIGQEIQAISWRLPTSASANWPPTDVTVPDYDLWLSPSVAPANRSTTDFSSNVAGPQKQVRIGSLFIPMNSYTFGNTPNDWGPEITFDSLYLYTGGHLLIELRLTGTGSNRSNDAVTTSTSGYDTLFSACWGNGYNANSGSQANFSIVRLTTDDPIPVELTSFAASIIDNSVILEWTTATEINNLGFEIERSINSISETIGFVSGAGSTVEPRYYSYTDKQVAGGTYYYRLKQIDFEGSHNYTDEIEVEVTALDVYTLEQNHPNPFNPSTKIRYSIPQTSNVVIKVFDIIGNEIEILVNREKQTGIYETTWYAENLPSGIYFYQLKAGDFVETKKMVLMK
ncbi:MAG: T9SS type A sorting domain-containing protein [Ignavibacteria bacterium]|nr:T9SS type A sorting domain-containing protein [Ignavibacteria bacterium]